MTDLDIAYIGNFEPEHSTENHVRQALEHLGHRVHRHQENQLGNWIQLEDVRAGEYDLLLWTRTGWDPPIPHDLQYSVLQRMSDTGTPTLGFHLDRWWGLAREDQVRTEPFFECDVVATADGGHDAEWEAARVNHVWSPPAVSEFECALGFPQKRLRSPLGFVGSWQPGYHAEWWHRPELIAHLEAKYKGQCRMWPLPGQHAVRGQKLRDLYASIDIVVGDSCLAGDRKSLRIDSHDPPASRFVSAPLATRYWSDRIPETLGRGGFLLHPFVEGLPEYFEPGRHLGCWEAGDWETLDALIAHYRKHPEERSRIAEAGRAHVLAEHTYTHRMAWLLSHMEAYR